MSVLRIKDLWERSKPEGSCWIWTGAYASDKYSPRIWTFDHDKGEKRSMTGPRAVWNIAHGQGLGDRVAYMRCCNSKCVNPAHVGAAVSKAEIGAHIATNGKRKGTHVAARRSNVEKALRARGITPTPDHIVLAVRAAEGTNVAIAARLGLRHQTVSLMRRGLSHRDLLEAA